MVFSTHVDVTAKSALILALYAHSSSAFTPSDETVAAAKGAAASISNAAAARQLP